MIHSTGHTLKIICSYALAVSVAVTMSCERKDEPATLEESQIEVPSEVVWQCVAYMSLTSEGDLERCKYAMGLLRKNKIDCSSEGNMIFAIYVPEKDLARALEIFKGAQKLDGHWRVPEM